MQTISEDQKLIIKAKIDKYERLLTTLRCSDFREVRLTFGSVGGLTVNNSLLPVSKVKKIYMTEIEKRLIELKYELLNREK